MKKKNNVVAIAFLFLMMILAAMADGARGVFIPSFKSEFGIDDNTISYMFIFVAASYTIFTFIGGKLCDKVGQKKVFLLGLAIQVGSLLTLSISKDYSMLLIGTTLASGAGALTSIASNTILPALVISAQTIIMNVLHSCYGFGSFIGQGASGALVGNGIEWRYIYAGIGILYFITLVAFLFVKIPSTSSESTVEKVKLASIFKNKLILVYMIALGTYVFSEQAVGGWLVNFMVSTYRSDVQFAGMIASAFFAFLAIGRLFGGFVVQKRGYFNILYKSLLIGFSIIFVALIIGEKASIIIPLAGLFFSITFPTVVLTMCKVFEGQSTYVISIVITVSSCINMILNRVIGFLSSVIGLDKAFYMIPFSALVSGILMIYLYKATKAKLNPKAESEIENKLNTEAELIG
ncbi:MFS transporter [Clostridium tarantellae]|uniref:MFS transporter n=1 Tax=Clostridium tarantellae TaxID=39493 RepID=A0A6I1MH67_9CLOT|nr:MFS transporter [Clostridium tarantellae]MPQ42876.1 MFS transporter [Clostridium tarantellae]